MNNKIPNLGTCDESTISFNDIPAAMVYIINKVDTLETLLNKVETLETMLNRQPQAQQAQQSAAADQWFNINELCKYHPDNPARQTVYGWIGRRYIPYHKKGKKLMFLKSEIDAWLKGGRRKTAAEIQAEVQNYIDIKRALKSNEQSN